MCRSPRRRSESRPARSGRLPNRPSAPPTPSLADPGALRSPGMIEVPIALEHAEAARTDRREGSHVQLGRVLQRPPQPLAVPGSDEPIGVVHLGAIVVGRRAAVLAAKEHAGERSDAQLLDLPCAHRSASRRRPASGARARRRSDRHPPRSGCRAARRASTPALRHRAARARTRETTGTPLPTTSPCRSRALGPRAHRPARGRRRGSSSRRRRRSPRPGSSGS